MDYTSDAGGSSLTNLATGYTFTINQSSYNAGTTFLLSDYVTGTDYTSTSVTPYFGNERTFPGNVSVVRATDIAEMSFDANLPTGKFTTSQNPTISGNPRITEVALLNSNKEALAFGKLAAPLERTGTQVISVKIDF